MNKGRILVVDDELKMRRILSMALSDDGYEVSEADNGRSALEKLSSEGFDLVLTDMKIPEMSGIDLLKKVKEKAPGMPVVIMTAYGTVETAVSAMKQGAYDYILKPFDMDDMRMTISKALQVEKLKRDNRMLRQELASKYGFENIIGKSRKMQEVFRLMKQVAPNPTTVLVSGESGTGKELVSRAVHALSPRADKMFVAVNCAALPEALLESELFGHAKGAFTGASAERAGRFEAADGGTIFLDEISSMSPALQAKILRVLQEMEFERLGEHRTRKVDVRVIAATNIDLRKAMERGSFREDLYFRLDVFSINLPPLRERKEDIPLLAQRFVEKYNAELKKGIKGVTPAAMECLTAYEWPGNVRELENAMERSVVLEQSDMITPDALRHDITGKAKAAAAEPEIPVGKISLEEMEKKMILRALEMAKGNKSRAAEILGITRNTLRYRLEKLDDVVDLHQNGQP